MNHRPQRFGFFYRRFSGRAAGLAFMLFSAGLLSSIEAREKELLPPVVKIARAKIVIGESAVTLEADVRDPDSDAKKFPLKLQWTQLDGPKPAEIAKPDSQSTIAKGLVPGRYTFRLAATDRDELTASAETTVTVRPAPADVVTLDADDPRLLIIGRSYAPSPKVIELGWGGVTMKARFTGTSVRARLKAGWGPAPRLLAIIDGHADAAVPVYADVRSDYLLAENLAPGEHTLELVRATGAWNAAAEFRGLVLDPGAKLLDPPPRAARRIEFYGDSITEGSYMADQPFTNAHAAYALATARLLDAEAHLAAKGGIGMVRGYVLPQTLPGIYDRAVPMRGDKKWDFSKWTPHVVVVNAFQNDKWTQGKVPPEEFIAAYAAFLKTLRGHYPRAHLVAALGSMDAVEPKSPWPGYLREAVARFQKETGDTRIAVFFFDYLGAKGHPTAAQARTMAEKLAAFLKAKGDGLWDDQEPPVRPAR